MSGIVFRYLAYYGPKKETASLAFKPGLNVICGASDTGKSFVVESIDFMLGQQEPVRDIPERAGYDRVRLAVECEGWSALTLERSVEGGHFKSYGELLAESVPHAEAKTLRWQHSAARNDTLSFALLQRTGLIEKTLRVNKSGKTRSLSFRDLARLCVVTEDEIMRRGSPLLSGQWLSATAEYAAFKLLITGTDDSALVPAGAAGVQHKEETGKIELLEEMIKDLQTELDEEGIDEGELKPQLARLEESIRAQNEALLNTQKVLDTMLENRANAAKEFRRRKARLAEIDELVERFTLLDSHYESDLNRLEAIRESGSLFIHLQARACPLCGALPGDQHLDSQCEGNTEEVVRAAEGEMVKIKRLRRELTDTILCLTAEGDTLQKLLPTYKEEYDRCEREIAEVTVPAVSTERTTYNALICERADVRSALEKASRLTHLVAQRAELERTISEEPEGEAGTRTQVSKNTLDEFAQTVERILREWHFPYASRVFFDEKSRDFQIAGKGRGSTGKGLRAITHAAVKIGLLEFCSERGLPHPGFVVLDSPLLAYWKPEGSEDDLRGTDVKEMFYGYLLGLQRNSQVIIVENQHPPDFVFEEGNVTVFTKNPHHGRYGFFPISQELTRGDEP